MYTFIASLFLFLSLFALDVTPQPKEIKDTMWNGEHFSEVIQVYKGLNCREGFSNEPDDLIDAAYHCASIEHTQVSKMKFTDEKVLVGGATPLFCLRACVMQQAGVVNQNREGLNETAVMKLFRQIMSKPGGEMSAYILTKELMECDKIHPFKNPISENYNNCSEPKEFLMCSKPVLTDCTSNDSDKKKKYREQFLKENH